MIIGLTGYAGAGKDTVAKFLVEELGFIRVAFADPVREFVYEINPPLDGPTLKSIVDDYGWDIAKANPEIRRLLQNVGLGARKVFGETFWVDQAMKKIYDPDKSFVITDVRFINEAQWLKTNGAQIWRVIRPNIGPVNDHVSETDLDNFPADKVLINNSGLDGLENQIKACLNVL